MKKYSELTFNQLAKDLGFIKVVWNGKVIFDDTADIPLVDLNTLYKEYGNRYVYDMKLKVVEGHHCELKIKGEENYSARQLVVGLYCQPDIYEHNLVDEEDLLELTISNKPLAEEVSIFDYFKRFEPTYKYRKVYKLYEAKVKNLNKYPWIRTCSKFYVFKEISNEKN